MSIARNSVLILISEIAVALFGIAASVAIARVLGPSDRGVYALIFILNRMIVNLSNCGITFANTTMASKNKYTISDLNGNSILTALLIGLLCWVLYGVSYLLLGLQVFMGVDPFYIFIAVSLVPVLLYDKFWNGIMTGLNQFKLLSILNTVCTLTGTVLTLIVLLILGWGIKGLIGLWVVESICWVLVKFFIIRRHANLKIAFNKRLFIEVISLGLKGHISSIASYIFTRVDVFFVNHFTGTAGVGWYTLSVSLAERTTLLPYSVIGASIPRVGGSERTQSVALTTKVMRHSLFLVGSSVALMGMAAPWGIPFLYGVDYIPSVHPVLLLLPGIVFLVFATGIAHFFSYQMERPQVSAVCAWITLIIYIPLSLFMISHWGILGAAVSSSIAHFTEFTLLFLLFRKETVIKVKDAFWLRREEWDDARGFLNQGLRNIRGYVPGLKTGIHEGTS